MKILHTVAWAVLAGCVIAIPVLAVRQRLRAAVVCSAIVLVEIGVLVANGMRCPLTDLAARYTADRSPAFDIYLPQWFAPINQEVFGTLFVLGELVLLVCWRRARAGPSRRL